MGIFKWFRGKGNLDNTRPVPRHIAVIMDGNGRWAKKRGMPRSAGHAVGAETFRTIATYCKDIGVQYFTVYAFSTENWKRPPEEVNALMDLFRKYLTEAAETMAQRGVAVRVLGDLSPLPGDIQKQIAEVDTIADSLGENAATASLCINYGGRDEIKNAVRAIAKDIESGKLLPEAITEDTISERLYTAHMPDPDLIIRPSGEIRTSNFLLWQSAYSEYYFTDILWPDFSTADMDKAIDEFNRRNRRFGGFESLIPKYKSGVLSFMKARVLFGVGGFIFVLLALYVLPPVVLYAAMTGLCMLAAYELAVPTGMVRSKWLLAWALTGAFCQSVLDCTGAPAVYQMAMLLVCVLAAFAVLLREHQSIQFSDVAAALFAGTVLPYMLSALTRMFQWRGGEFLVLLPLVAAWGSDTCALFAGMAFGKHKLAPVISPKKTVEGSVGGVIGATLLMLLAVYLINRFAGLGIHYGAAALMGACGAVIGQVGDLAFSIIKRQSGIKDYGHIFPGHGGVLDRFDSVIFVAPVAELILIAAGAHI